MEKEAERLVSLAQSNDTDFCAQLNAELDDYRAAINENTDEIGFCFEYAQALDRKIEKLAERIDELAHLLGPLQRPKKAQIEPLTEKEKYVFMILYALVEEKQWITYKQLTAKVSMSESQIVSLLAALVRKGIPILKKYSAGLAYLGLERGFCEEQAKKNFLKMTTPLSYWLH